MVCAVPVWVRLATVVYELCGCVRGLGWSVCRAVCRCVLWCHVHWCGCVWLQLCVCSVDCVYVCVLVVLVLQYWMCVVVHVCGSTRLCVIVWWWCVVCVVCVVRDVLCVLCVV